jgi:hypothetical protein
MPLFALRPSQPAHGGTEHDEIIARNDDGLGECMGSLGRCNKGQRPPRCRAERNYPRSCVSSCLTSAARCGGMGVRRGVGKVRWPPAVSRGGALIDMDREKLEARMEAYFDQSVTFEGYKLQGGSLSRKLGSV